MNEQKYRYRNKGTKIQVQKLEGDKWISRTLPPPEEVFLWLCPTTVSPPTHKTIPQEQEKPSQKFAQDILYELSKEDTNLPIVGLETDEELKTKAKEALRKLGI